MRQIAMDLSKTIDEIDLENKLEQMQHRKPKPETEEQYIRKFLESR